LRVFSQLDLEAAIAHSLCAAFGARICLLIERHVALGALAKPGHLFPAKYDLLPTGKIGFALRSAILTSLPVKRNINQGAGHERTWWSQ
jgi:hypothetical protein